MLKYAVAATHMLQNSDYSLVFPQEAKGIELPDRAMTPFSDEVIDFLNRLSSSLLHDKNCRKYPDVMTFAFFCRRSNILALKGKHSPNGLRLGRGSVFHIAPGNVPVNFAYSLLVGLLSGNNNIVKLSSKPFPQVDIIVRHLDTLSDDPVAKRILLVRYPHESHASEEFSSIADARVIWGGDETIRRLRKCPTPSRSIDICFADRYSLCAIGADAMIKLSESELKDLAERFYNDTFLFDQNACTAPHLIVWIGNNDVIVKAKKAFWKAIHDYTASRYTLQPVMAVDKLTALFRQSVEMNVKAVPTEDNLIVRTSASGLDPNIENLRCASGFFTEYSASSLDEITGIITTKYQTLSYFGIDCQQIERFIKDNRPKGIDRIVPIGETTDFSLIWDGYDLISTLSREISLI